MSESNANTIWPMSHNPHNQSRRTKCALISDKINKSRHNLLFLLYYSTKIILNMYSFVRIISIYGLNMLENVIWLILFLCPFGWYWYTVQRDWWEISSLAQISYNDSYFFFTDCIFARRYTMVCTKWMTNHPIITKPVSIGINTNIFCVYTSLRNASECRWISL